MEEATNIANMATVEVIRAPLPVEDVLGYFIIIILAGIFIFLLLKKFREKKKKVEDSGPQRIVDDKDEIWLP